MNDVDSLKVKVEAYVCALCLGKGAYILTDKYPEAGDSYPIATRCNCGVDVQPGTTVNDFAWYVFVDRSAGAKHEAA